MGLASIGDSWGGAGGVNGWENTGRSGAGQIGVRAGARVTVWIGGVSISTRHLHATQFSAQELLSQLAPREVPQLQWCQEIDTCHILDILNAFRSENHKFCRETSVTAGFKGAKF